MTVIVNRDKGLQGRAPGDFSSDRVFVCDLDSSEEAALARMTRDAGPGSVEATPLGAFVERSNGLRVGRPGESPMRGVDVDRVSGRQAT